MYNNFEKMSQTELIEYIKSDFQSNDGFDINDLVWTYCSSFKLSDIIIDSMNNKKDWIDWINNERKMFKEDMGYDRYKEIEEYWIHNPSQEPIIIIQRHNGTHDISDGWHRTGLAFRNNLKEIPVILGVIN